MQQPNRAIELAQDALLLAPQNCYIWNTLAAAYELFGNDTLALRAAERGLEWAETAQASAADQADCARQIERIRERVADGGESVPEQIDVSAAAVEKWILVGRRSLASGALARAMGAFSLAALHDPENRNALFGEATCYMNAHQMRKALAIFEQLAARYPQDYSTLNNIAWLYATAEDPGIRNGKRAVAVAQNAILLAPDNYHIWSTLSEAHYLAGNYERAWRAARSALELAVSNEGTPAERASYQKQVHKCRQALNAMSLIE